MTVLSVLDAERAEIKVSVCTGGIAHTGLWLYLCQEQGVHKPKGLSVLVVEHTLIFLFFFSFFFFMTSRHTVQCFLESPSIVIFWMYSS